MKTCVQKCVPLWSWFEIHIRISNVQYLWSWLKFTFGNWMFCMGSHKLNNYLSRTLQAVLILLLSHPPHDHLITDFRHSIILFPQLDLFAFWLDLGTDHFISIAISCTSMLSNGLQFVRKCTYLALSNTSWMNWCQVCCFMKLLQHAVAFFLTQHHCNAFKLFL